MARQTRPRRPHPAHPRPDVVERWTNRLWDGLRDNLLDDRPDEAGIRVDDRLAAIVLLLEQRMSDEAVTMVAGPPAAPAPVRRRRWWWPR